MRTPAQQRRIHDLQTDRDGYAVACAQAVLANDMDQARIQAEAYGRAVQALLEAIEESA